MQLLKNERSHRRDRSVPRSDGDALIQLRSISSASDPSGALALGVNQTAKLLSMQETKMLLSALEKSPAALDARDIITTILHTGVRPGELRNLRWMDVDFNAHCFIVKTKGASNRRVPFGPMVFRILEERRQRGPSSNFVLGVEPEKVLRRVSQRIRSMSLSIRKRSVTLYPFRRAFFVRWISYGGSSDLLALVGGFDSLNSGYRTLHSLDQRYAVAAEFQARLEEQEL